jgi:hypothetical protein
MIEAAELGGVARSTSETGMMITSNLKFMIYLFASRIHF